MQEREDSLARHVARTMCVAEPRAKLPLDREDLQNMRTSQSQHHCLIALWLLVFIIPQSHKHQKVTAVGLEPTPVRTGALSHRLRPLGHTVLVEWFKQVGPTRNHVLVVQGGWGVPHTWAATHAARPRCGAHTRRALVPAMPNTRAHTTDACARPTPPRHMQAVRVARAARTHTRGGHTLCAAT